MNAQAKAKKDYGKEVLDSVVNALDSLPDAPPNRAMSAREMVFVTAEKIKARLDAGYTYQQIVETLGNAGFKISAGTLKTYLSVASQQTKQSKQKPKPLGNTSVNTSGTFAAKEVKAEAIPAAPAARPMANKRPAFQDPDEK